MWNEHAEGNNGTYQYLCGSMSTGTNAWDGSSSLGKTDIGKIKNSDPNGTTLTENNIWVLVNAGKVNKTNSDGTTVQLQQFYIKNLKTQQYIVGDATAHSPGTKNLYTAPEKSKATAFIFEDPSTYGLNEGNWELDEVGGVVISHVESDGSVKNHMGPFWNYTFTYYGDATDMIAWNLYTPKYDSSFKTLLKVLVDSISSAGTTYVAGNDPGNYSADEIDIYEIALAEAQDAIDMDDDEASCKTIFEKLNKAIADLEATRIELTDGYYYIVNQWPDFITKRGSELALFCTSDHFMMWGPAKTTLPEQVWKITKQDDGRYAVQNYGLSTYMNYAKSNAWNFIETTDELETPQNITYYGKGAFKFSNLKTGADKFYYPDCWGGSTPTSYVQASTSYADQALWYLRRVPQNVVDSMAASAATMTNSARLESLLDEANAVYNSCFSYDADKGEGKGLIKNATMGDANSQVAYSSCSYDITAGTGENGKTDNLIDGDPKTYFRTATSSAGMLEHQYLLFTLPEPTQTFVIAMAKRDNQYGQNDRPRTVVIYGSNDEGTNEEKNWTKIETYHPSLLNAVVYDYHAVDMGKPYKYVKYSIFDTNNHGRSWNFVYTAIGELQLYPATLNKEYSQYSYVPGMKAACDKLQQELTTSRNMVAEGNATPEEYTALKTAIENVKALYVDTLNLYAAIKQATDYAKAFNVGEDYGQVEQATYDALIQAGETANNYDHLKPVKADQESRLAALNNAFKAFVAKQKTIEPNVWYYIQNSDTTRDGDTATSINNMKVYGNAIYAPSNNVASERLTKGVDEIEHGNYDRDNDNFNAAYDPYSMWRLVPIETSDTLKTYALQNRGTGTYLNVFESLSRGGMSATPQPYKLNFAGPGEFTIESTDSANLINNQTLYAAGDGFVTYNTLSGLSSSILPAYNSPNSWTFTKVKGDIDAVEIKVVDNSLSFITLPYSSPGFFTLNTNAKAYTLKDMPDANTVNFTLTNPDEGLKAGVPYLLLIGDTAAYNAEHPDTVAIAVEAPTDFVAEATTANGLVGVLHGTTVEDGLGIIAANKLSATQSGDFIEGHSAYINPKLVVAQSGKTDLTLTTTDIISGINTAVVTKAGQKVNVYSIDGKLLKKNVNAAEAMKNLGKGIYIIGKKKIAVK